MKFLISSLIAAAAVFSTSAYAGDRWGHNNDRGRHDDRWQHRHHHRAQPVFVPYAYAAPRVVYQAAPVVVYRERIVYRDRPVYYEEAPRNYGDEQQPAAYGDRGNRLIGQTLGAIAGGALGTQVGQGNGRIAATVIGAVVGSAIGGNAAGY